MDLSLVRESSGVHGTLGKLFMDGKFFAFTLEPDEDRANHPAIPLGTYTVIVTPSLRFKRMLPLIIGVKGRNGIRIHPGNTSADSEGCILLGMSQTANAVQSSRAACELFQSAIAPSLARQIPVTLTISEGQRTVQA